MTAKIKLNAASGGGSVSLQAPTSTTNDANLEFKLPVVDGSSGQVIKTDGSGNLSFDGGGKVKQFLSDVKTDTASFSLNAGYTGLFSTYGLLVQITPTSASNKLLIFGQVCVNKESQGLINLVITKDGSLLTGAIGDAGGSRKRITSGGFNDGSTVIETIPFSAVVTAGNTSQQEFTVGIMHDSGSAKTMYINRGSEDTPDNQYRYRGASMIQVMEVEP